MARRRQHEKGSNRLSLCEIIFAKSKDISKDFEPENELVKRSKNREPRYRTADLCSAVNTSSRQKSHLPSGIKLMAVSSAIERPTRGRGD